MAEDSESLEQLQARHEEEEGELEEKVRSHLTAASSGGAKGKKAKAAQVAAEREVEQWRYDFSVRHQEEREALEEEEGGGAEADTGGRKAQQADDGSPKKAEEAAAPKLSPEEEEAERILRKKEKAQKKRQNKASKEADRERELEAERRAAGPSRRALELTAISARLAKRKPPLKVSEVLGDGHCLYRSLADQIRRVRPDLQGWEGKQDTAFQEIRAVCAASLRRRRDLYEAFAELNDGEDFEAYCKRVEHSADWGGQLELRAVADQLEVQILVHRAEQGEPLVIGDSASGEPLHVTFHQYWYALGEHYNSAVLADA